MRSQRIELAIATAAAISAYAFAFLPPTRPQLRWGAVVLAASVSLIASAIRWTGAPAWPLRWASLGLRLQLIVIGALVVFARQFPLVPYADGRRVGGRVGAALALSALVFLAGRRLWAVHSHLVPALAGVLVAAGLEKGEPSFLPLAAVAGLAVWVDAFRNGGPRRFGGPLVASVAAGAALAAGIAWVLPVAQPHVQEMIARAYREGRTGLSDRSELGEIASLAESRNVVARVWTDRPQLLRLQVFSQFDGRRWASFPPGSRRMTRIERPRMGALLGGTPGLVFAADARPLVARGLTETRVLPELWMEDGWGVLAPSGPVLLVWPDHGVAIDDRGLVSTGGAAARLYGVANRPPAGSPVAPADVDLALPLRLDPRVRALADSLRGGEPPGPALVARTVEHLRFQYRYTLHPGRFTSRDPLAEFLFDKRAGYCEYFATAAVVLLRLQGVPARYVKGVAVRSEARVGTHYVVRESDAHAWVDVWTAGAGWTEVDPTPGDGWAATHPEPPPSVLAALWERAAATLAQGWARWRQGAFPGLTTTLGRAASSIGRMVLEHRWLVLGLLGALGIALLIARRPPAAAGAESLESVAIGPELAAALRGIEQHWTRAGRARPAVRGLVEHLDGLPEGALSEEARALSARVVRAVYESGFGGRPPAPAEAEALAQAVRDLSRTHSASR